MSTITTHSSQELVSTLMAHFRPADEKTFAIQLDENRAVIAVLPESDRDIGPDQIESSFTETTAEARRESMRAWLESIAVPAGLSDYAVSSESIYSPDE